MSNPAINLTYNLDQGITFEMVPASDSRLTDAMRQTMQSRAKLYAVILHQPDSNMDEMNRQFGEKLLATLSTHGRVQGETLLVGTPDQSGNQYTFLAAEELVMAMTECGIINSDIHNKIRTDMRLYTGMGEDPINVSDLLGEGFGALPKRVVKPKTPRGRI